MPKLNKMLAMVKREAEREAERREYEEMQQAFERMSVAQLLELVELWEREEDDPIADNRVKEIFASVDALHLLESG